MGQQLQNANVKLPKRIAGTHSRSHCCGMVQQQHVQIRVTVPRGQTPTETCDASATTVESAHQTGSALLGRDGSLLPCNCYLLSS